MKGNIYELQKLLDEFIEKRNWQKYHSPKNLSMAISIEASELMEHFLWCEKNASEFSKEEREEIGEEMADVLHFLLRLSSVMDIDLYEASKKKIAKNEKRFKIEDANSIKKKGC
ncbi:nucleotide pyrophosphohydrolase [Nitrosophilus alvini]|uniref:nucleotide pyrophosphohydrolase n=1 Tax=Nitrosophilus alvini TaxID=2714855 RepID=UPI00190A3A89|nr:nucleotide pyrophosphohydrolase [Nitrosophilus alvini]